MDQLLSISTLAGAVAHHEILTTFVAASVLGVVLLILSGRLKVSAIVLLLIGGILAGPEVIGIVEPESLGSGLNTIISLAVGIILFEGGLTLDVKGLRRVSSEIRGVLTIGVVTTWVTTAVAIKLIFDFEPVFCALAGSLIIVTGPTVIGPILSRIRVKKHIHDILHWEGVLIDPIGVFIALLCYEWIVATGAGAGEAVMNFLLRILVGSTLGVGFGIAIYQVLKRNWVPENSLNIFVLAAAMLNIMIADTLVTESGLLSVTIAGLVVGYRDTPQLDRIIEYKVELKDFLIGLLFILLAANLELKKFLSYGLSLAGIVVVVMLLVRPLNIFLSMRKSQLTIKEKLFLSWIAPRGIVAASMASLFAFNLADAGWANAGFLESFAYSVIAGTVVFQGFTAKMVGGALGVLEPKPKSWLIIGAHALGREVAKFIQNRGEIVVLMDTNPREVKLALREGLTALNENAMAVEPENRIELYGIGNVLSITENEDLNRLVCQRWNKLLPSPRLFRWVAESIPDSNLNANLLVGLPVWQEIQLKAVLAQSSKSGNIRFREYDLNFKMPANPDTVLITFYNGEFYAGFEPLPEDYEGDAWALVLEQEEHVLELPTKPEWVVFSNADVLRNLYGEMLNVLDNDFPNLDHERLLKELLEREEEFTSLIGHGISLPHTYTAAIDKTILVAARVKPGLPCRHTGSDINLIFMLLSPENQPVEHLNQISKIAKFVMREENREALLAAENREDLCRVMERA